MAGLLEEIGLGRDRIRMINLSSAMAVQFAEAVVDMTQDVQGLGPNPLQDMRESDSEV